MSSRKKKQVVTAARRESVVPQAKVLEKQVLPEVTVPRALRVFRRMAIACAVAAAASLIVLVLFLRNPGGSVSEMTKEQGRVFNIFRTNLVSYNGKVYRVKRMASGSGVVLAKDGGETEVRIVDTLPVRIVEGKNK